MDAFVVRTKRGEADASISSKPGTSKIARTSPDGAGGAASDSSPDPTVLITWNANGATPRAKDDAEITTFMDQHQPDVLFVQEARLRAVGPNQRGRPAPLKVTSNPSTTEVASALFVGSRYLDRYVRHFSLADKKAAGTMVLVRRGIAHDVYSSWHAALTAHGALPASADFAPEAHHPEGRMQYVRFQSFDCLHTYVQNSGYTAESIAKRALWDADLDKFLRMRAELTARPLVWAGDMNVAHTQHDSTDEAFFQSLNQPGFLSGERSRFSGLLEAGGLVDIWRLLHPVGPTPPPRESAAFTWRGSMKAAGSVHAAKFEGKAMRIDYFCATTSFAEQRVVGCEILGHSTTRIGFLGSDHAPVKLTLRKLDDAHTEAVKNSIELQT